MSVLPSNSTHDGQVQQAQQDVIADWRAALPVYDWSSPPVLGAEVDATTCSEREDNFFRTARWSPDGSGILTVGEDRCIRLYDQPSSDSVTWQPKLSIPYPSSIFSATWYPAASQSTPGSFCFVVGVSDAPVRLIDGATGKLRASYPIIDHTERFRAPSSMAFSPDATKLYCGHDTAIEVFDFNSPGEEATRLKTSHSRRSKDGQKGLISALAFSPDTASGLFAAGSYTGNGSVFFYTEDTGETSVAELELGSAAGRGVTQLAFHPLNPSIVFVASRLSDSIGVYDIRNTMAGPYTQLYRPGRTQQRIEFSVDWGGRWISSGAIDGKLRVWGIGEAASEVPVFEQQIADDCIGSVSMHPFKPLILSSSGSRHGPLEDVADADSGSDSDSDSDGTASESSSGDESIEEDMETNSRVPDRARSSAHMRVHSFATCRQGS